MTREKVGFWLAFVPCEKVGRKGGVPLKRGTTHHLSMFWWKNICFPTFPTFSEMRANEA